MERRQSPWGRDTILWETGENFPTLSQTLSNWLKLALSYKHAPSMEPSGPALRCLQKRSANSVHRNTCTQMQIPLTLNSHLKLEILEEINPDIHRKAWCWSWSSSTLATWCEELEENLMLGQIEGGRRRGQQRMRWVDSITKLNGHEFEQTVRWWRTVKPGMLQSMGLQRVRHDWATKQQHIIIPIQRMI